MATASGGDELRSGESQGRGEATGEGERSGGCVALGGGVQSVEEGERQAGGGRGSRARAMPRSFWRGGRRQGGKAVVGWAGTEAGPALLQVSAR